MFQLVLILFDFQLEPVDYSQFLQNYFQTPDRKEVHKFPEANFAFLQFGPQISVFDLRIAELTEFVQTQTKRRSFLPALQIEKIRLNLAVLVFKSALILQQYL